MRNKKSLKNKLAYSELTDTVYYIDGRGEKKNITPNFIGVMCLWLQQGEEIELNQKFEREIEFVSGLKCSLQYVFSKGWNVQASVATEDDSSNADGQQK